MRAALASPVRLKVKVPLVRPASLALSSLAVYVLMAVVLALKPDGLFPVKKR